VTAAINSSPPPEKPTKVHASIAADTLIGERYRIVKKLGEGASGTVYVAEHVLLHKRIALKILHPELTDTSEGVARFEREAMATSRIEHPNVAAAIDFGRLPEGAMYLALEYVEGTSLRDELAKGPLGVERALYVGRQIASAIAAAQALDIVHRDLKPENVMLVTKGSDTDFVKVLDFGIARVPVDEGSIGGSPALTKAGAVFGTAEYMPPEQGIGQKVDSRADLYALGVMLFEMVAGVRPYGTRDDLGILAQQLTQPLPTLAERAKGIEAPASLQRLINRLLAKRPQERISQAEDVVRALDSIITGEAPGSAGPPVSATADEPLPAFSLQTQLPGTLSAPEPDSLAEKAMPTDGEDNAAPRVQAKPSQAPKAVVVASALSKSVGQYFSKATTVVDTRRKGLPEPMRTWLLKVPAGALVIALLGLVLFTVVGIFVGVQRANASRASAAASASASALVAAQAEAAAKASAAAARPAPIVDGDSNAGAGEGDSKDPNAMLDQAQKKLRENKDADAVNTVAHVLGKHPDRRNDARVAAILFKTASSTVKGVANTTFSLLEGTMAAPGAEIVYQIAADKSLPSYVRTRAEKWLHTPQFERAASDALRIASNLRFASTCDAKRALLGAASKAGGTAALAYLHELQGETGCGLSGKDDCYACLRGDSALSDAIKAIETRLKQ